MRKWSLIWACLPLFPSILSPRRQSHSVQRFGFVSFAWAGRLRDGRLAERRLQEGSSPRSRSMSSRPAIALLWPLSWKAELGSSMCSEVSAWCGPDPGPKAFRMPCWKLWPWRSLAWPRAFTACPKWWWMGRQATALKLARRQILLQFAVEFHGILEAFRSPCHKPESKSEVPHAWLRSAIRRANPVQPRSKKSFTSHFPEL